MDIDELREKLFVDERGRLGQVAPVCTDCHLRIIPDRGVWWQTHNARTQGLLDHQRACNLELFAFVILGDWRDEDSATPDGKYFDTLIFGHNLHCAEQRLGRGRDGVLGDAVCFL